MTCVYIGPLGLSFRSQNTRNMFTGSLAYLDIVLGVAGVLLVWHLLLKKKAAAPHPPGPKGLPVVGNVVDMPTSHEWYKFAEWKEQYGTTNSHIYCSLPLSD